LGHRVGDRVALGQLLGTATHQALDGALGDSVVAVGQVADAGLGDDSPQANRRWVPPGAPGGSLARPAAHSASWPPAEWPRMLTRSRSIGASIVARWSIAVATSSKVVGQPPPSPTRRYSMFHTAQPRRMRSPARPRITILP